MQSRAFHFSLLISLRPTELELLTARQLLYLGAAKKLIDAVDPKHRVWLPNEAEQVPKKSLAIGRGFFFFDAKISLNYFALFTNGDQFHSKLGSV